ncbi:MAG: acetyl-CoA acetyltransferase [Pseudomonadota bacterium]
MTDNTPVLVGIAQLEQRISDPAQAKEPIELMIDAVQAAAADAGTSELLKATSVRVVRGIWGYENPAAAVASAIGNPGAETALTPYGGNFVQTTVNRSALDIQSGKHDAIIITGAECGNTQAKAARAGHELTWQAIPGTPDLMLGEEKEMRHEAEKAIRLGRPIQLYPIFETALRHNQGLGVTEHLEKISNLWAGFSDVAASNPNAWIREAKTAQEIRTPSEINRPVSFPYPKFLNSNNNVDQGAALILCSTDHARKLGIPEEKWVYPWAGTDAHDHYFVSNRDTLYTSPAIRIAGNRCLELAGIEVGDIDKVDVYSCFPVAVQVAARELNLDQTKPLTVTGGLTWAGGPLNNYVMHSIAQMASLLRDNPGEKGLITANGGYLTKHAFGVYSSTPPEQAFRHQDVQPEVDQTFKREVDMNFSGSGEVEGYAVMYDNTGPANAFVAIRTPDERRAWATTTDADVLEQMTKEEFCGRTAAVNQHVANF